MVDVEEVIAQRAHAVSALTPPMMIANVINATATLLVLWLDGQLLPQAMLWAAVAIGFSLYFFWRWQSYRGKTFPTRLTARSIRRTTLRAAFLGLIWGFPGIIILPVTTGISQAFLVALAAGTVAAGAITLYPIPSAALAFSGIVAALNLAGFALTAHESVIGFTIVTLVFFYVIATSILRHERIFVSEFQSRRALDEHNRHIGALLEQTRADAIAERVTAEQRLVQAQKMEAIGQLTGGIAHDFNNLLATIQGHAELLAMDAGNDQTLTTPILRSTRRGADLTRRLLAFARRQTLRPEAVDVSELVGDMVEILRRTLRENIRIETEIAADLWPVHADPALLASALLNLATNSRDAMPDGGVIVVTAANQPGGTRGDGLVHLSVRDTGIGMTQEIRARAAEPFFTTKRFGHGSGLGLSMVHGFAEQSGGEIDIQSAENQGTTVTLRLPSTLDQPAAAAVPLVEKVLTGNGERILVIEDNADVRATVRKLLGSFDYTVSTVESVAEASAFLGGPLPPDVILSDVVLPGGTSGLEFARDLAGTHPEIAVVLMSGFANTEANGSTGAAIEFLTKPFNRADLAKAIFAACQKAEARKLKAAEGTGR
ncbi:ATP-binding protein [Algicella marina]|nr:ATP-binding protein [Algicella marina]